MPRIALIHALEESVAPAHAAFEAFWPEAGLVDLMDARLAPDLAAAGTLTPEIGRRIEALAHQAMDTRGADDPIAGILYTCSAFGPAIDAVKPLVPVPVLRPNEGAFEAALDHGGPVGLVVTFGPSAPALAAELRDMAAARGQVVEVTTALASGALEALKSGDGTRHDQLVAAAAATLGNCAVLVLGQFSMARAEGAVARTCAQPVLTTPRSAVERMRQLVTRG
jgi:Asp/Glu/hydantoin racemase